MNTKANNTKPMIIGITGEIGSGKTTAAKFYKNKHNATWYRYSDPLRAAADALGLPQEQEVTQDLSTFVRSHPFGKGEGHLSELLATRVLKDKNPLIALEGMRRLGDFEILQSLKDDPNSIKCFIFLYVDADIAIRHKRWNTRQKEEGKVTVSFEKFRDEVCEKEPEREIRSLRKYADHIIVNDDNTPDNFYSELEKAVGISS